MTTNELKTNFLYVPVTEVGAHVGLRKIKIIIIINGN